MLGDLELKGYLLYEFRLMFEPDVYRENRNGRDVTIREMVLSDILAKNKAI
jgi:hypothetical protein